MVFRVPLGRVSEWQGLKEEEAAAQVYFLSFVKICAFENSVRVGV